MIGYFYAETPYAAGDPWDVSTRWSDEQLIRKFMTSCPGSLGAGIANAVMSIDESVDWRSVMEDLATAAQILKSPVSCRAESSVLTK